MAAFFFKIFPRSLLLLLIALHGNAINPAENIDPDLEITRILGSRSRKAKTELCPRLITTLNSQEVSLEALKKSTDCILHYGSVFDKRQFYEVLSTLTTCPTVSPDYQVSCAKIIARNKKKRNAKVKTVTVDQISTAVQRLLDCAENAQTPADEVLGLAQTIFYAGNGAQKEYIHWLILKMLSNAALPLETHVEAADILMRNAKRRQQIPLCEALTNLFQKNPAWLTPQKSWVRYIFNSGPTKEKAQAVTQFIEMLTQEKDELENKNYLDYIDWITFQGLRNHHQALLKLCLETPNNTLWAEVVLEKAYRIQDAESKRLLPDLINLLPEPRHSPKIRNFIFAYGNTQQQIGVTQEMTAQLENPETLLRGQSEDYLAFALQRSLHTQQQVFCHILQNHFSNPQLSMEQRKKAGSLISQYGNLAQKWRTDLMIVNNPLLSEALLPLLDPIPTTQEQETLLNHGFEGRWGELYSFFSASWRQNLIRQTLSLPSSEWTLFIQNTMDQAMQSRLPPPPTEPPAGLAWEIHRYAKNVHAQVTAAINEALKDVPLIAYKEARSAAVQHIKRRSTIKDKVTARLTIDRGMYRLAAKTLFAQVYTFVSKFYPAQMETYMAGFVGESVLAYERSKNPGSCVKGVEERILTGLRGIAFDEMFQSPEAEATAKAFMANCNFQDHQRWMVQKLRELGVTHETDAQEARKKFQDYGTTYMQSLSLDEGKLAEYLSQIKDMGGLIEDFYDEVLQPAIRDDEERKGEKRKREEDHTPREAPGLG